MWGYVTILALNFFNNASKFKMVLLRAVSGVLAVGFEAFEGKESASKSFLDLFHVFKTLFPSR